MHVETLNVDISQSALESAYNRFRSERLPLPPIPRELESQLRQYGEWQFGTREQPVEFYALSPLIEEAALGAAPNYVAFGHAGHGVSSWAMHYCLVSGPLALFVQIAWGASTGPSSLGRIRLAFDMAGQLLVDAEDAAAAGRLQPTDRLIVVASDWDGERWRVASPSSQADGEWKVSAHAIGDAMAWLDSATE